MEGASCRLIRETCHKHFVALTLFLSTELEKQLVALIPYGDQRLKPRHT